MHFVANGSDKTLAIKFENFCFIFSAQHSTSCQLPVILHFHARCLRSLHNVLGSQGFRRAKGNEFPRRTVKISCSFLDGSTCIDDVNHDQQV